jgi:hypothetical protein
MQLKRDGDTLILKLTALQSRLLPRIFQTLQQAYHLKPDDIDSKTASTWYGMRGCGSAGMSEPETCEWLKHLHGFKVGQLTRLEGWLKQLDNPTTIAHELRIELTEADSFMNVLNDYRLMMAARQDIGETEMEIHSPDEIDKLPPSKRSALFEIHFLAWMLEEMLRVLHQVEK